MVLILWFTYPNRIGKKKEKKKNSRNDKEVSSFYTNKEVFTYFRCKARSQKSHTYVCHYAYHLQAGTLCNALSFFRLFEHQFL